MKNRRSWDKDMWQGHVAMTRDKCMVQRHGKRARDKGMGKGMWQGHGTIWDKCMRQGIGQGHGTGACGIWQVHGA